MGYVIAFYGILTFDRPFAPHHLAYLQAYVRIPRVRWDVDLVKNEPDPLREAVEIPLGEDGCYFTGHGFKDHYSYPPWRYLAGAERANIDPAYLGWQSSNIPGLNCPWMPSDDGTKLFIDGDKPYNWYKWLQYLLDHFLVPWGYILNGEMNWQGEEEKDTGLLLVENNKITAHRVSK